jgi:phosphoribosylanthranilate isomerase
MKVKICGITREEDAKAAVLAGADALGFVFVRSSKRWIGPEHARVIIEGLPPQVLPVGVFVDTPAEEIRRVVGITGVQLVQLHGDETPAEASAVGMPVWKAFRVGTAFDVACLSRYAVDGFLLDAHVEGQAGGTGKTFDWRIAVAAKPFGRIILSGGITADNAARAVRDVAPYAIDVSSGVESSPGIKDPLQIVRLFDAIRR